MLALLIALTVAGLVLAGGSAAAGTQSTSTAVTGCSPNPVALADTTTCTVVVTDTSGSPTTPSGSVSFASDSSGTFGGSPCTLTAVDSSSATCQVTYTPTAGAGTHTITASYTADDGVHIDSADSAGVGVTVSLRSTTTSISCSPTTVALNQATTCTATVVDTDSGTSSFPQGSVSFGRGGPAGSAGTFSSSGSCTLAQLGMSTTTSHCSLTYTPTAGAGTHTVSASYTPNDSIHATSGDSTDASVTATTRSY